MAGLQTNEFDTLCSQSSKKRNHEPTEIEEEAALALLMLSQDNRSWHTIPATSAAAVVELIKDVLNLATTAVTTTSERTAALASSDDDKKSMEPFLLLLSLLRRTRICRTFVVCATFTTGQALGGHMRRHYEGEIKGGKKTSGITSRGGAFSQCNSNGRTITVDFNLNQPALLETYSDFTLYIRQNFQVLGDQHKVESQIPFQKQRLDE
ncbi:zinc finger protein 1-like [Olea europaea var. sylvestris]|uniref:zinc finger protein 1-like n=1 Tax=Olea europaea var. sylvestris TaxID=158386 RepID=UPI000C1D7AE2|nr:zinc finger protein 1-like [Olea europaea var. sylvestris]